MAEQEANGTDMYYFQGHEDRISRLEEDRGDTKAQLADCNANLRSIGEKIDSLSDTVKESLEKVTTKINDHSERIKVMEAGDEADAKRVDWIRKTMIPLGLTGGGALIMFFLERFFGHH